MSVSTINESKRIAVINLQIQRGRAYSKKFTFTRNSVPMIDDTWSVKSEIRETSKKSSKLIAPFTVDTTDINSGIIYLTLDEDVSDISNNSGYYDIMLTDASNQPFSYVVGTISFYDVPSDEDAV